MVDNMEYKHQRALLRASADVAEERMRNSLEELVDKLRPNLVDMKIPSPNINNTIDMKPVAEVISAMLSMVKDQLAAAGKIDMTPVAEAINSGISLSENRPVPQVIVDMAPVSAALGEGIQSVVSAIEKQNENIEVLNAALTKLLVILSNQKPVQVKPQVVAESPSIVALVKEQREFFARIIDHLVDKPKRQIRITHGETESVVSEV